MQIARTNHAMGVGGFVAVAALLLAGCSSATTTAGAPPTGSATSKAADTSTSAAPASDTMSATPPTADTNAEKITLTVGLFGNIGFQKAGLYDEYTKLHPNITIKQDNVEQSSDYYKALQTHLAANGGLDDIQAIEIGFVADLVKNHVDQFVDFNTLPEGPQLKSTFYPWKWADASTPDGATTIGLGTDAGPEAMCYRQDLLKTAGLPNDTATLAKQWSTWDDFLAFGKKYEGAASKQAGSHFLDSPGSVFGPAVTQGEFAYDDASGKPIPGTSAGVKAAWGWASKAAADKLTAGLGQFSAPWNKAFSSGAFATLACPAWMLGYIQSQAGSATAGKWDVAPLPGGAANWGGSWLGVPKASTHPKEAAALAEWLTAPAQQISMWKDQGTFPSSSEAAKDPSIATKVDPYFHNAPVGQIFSDSASKLKRVPIGPYDTQIGQALGDALTSVANSGTDPDKAFKTAMDNINQVVGG